MPTDVQRVARRKLRMPNNAATPDDPRVHGINNQWRIGFPWKTGDALNVEIV